LKTGRTYKTRKKTYYCTCWKPLSHGRKQCFPQPPNLVLQGEKIYLKKIYIYIYIIPPSPFCSSLFSTRLKCFSSVIILSVISHNARLFLSRDGICVTAALQPFSLCFKTALSLAGGITTMRTGDKEATEWRRTGRWRRPCARRFLHSFAVLLLLLSLTPSATKQGFYFLFFFSYIRVYSSIFCLKRFQGFVQSRAEWLSSSERYSGYEEGRIDLCKSGGDDCGSSNNKKGNRFRQQPQCECPIITFGLILFQLQNVSSLC
jgi:hypothetical protein